MKGLVRDHKKRYRSNVRILSHFAKSGMILLLLTLRYDIVNAEDAIDLMKPGAVIKGFSVPRFNEEGKTIAQLHGESAKVLDRDNILLQKIDYRTTITNQSFFRFEAENGVFNRKTEFLTSKKHVHFYRDNLKISGVGLVWNLKNSQCHLKSNVVMTIQNMNKGFTQ